MNACSMPKSWVYRTTFLAFCAAGGVGVSGQALADAAEIAPFATPEGITFQPIGLAQGYSLNKESATKLPRNEIVFTNADGMTLYTYDNDLPGKSVCVDACAETWPPALAPDYAAPFGDWSVIDRDDGSRQWAYRNKPLYTYVLDVDIGSVGGNSPKRFGRGEKVGPRGRTSASIPKDEPLPQGWHAAFMYPMTDLSLPGGFQAKEIGDAMGVVLVDERTARTLYVFDGDVNEAMRICADNDQCADRWIPLMAPRIALPSDNFGVETRDDGITQWTYKGRALFRYAGDLTPMDANGVGVDERWNAAYVVRFFAPETVALEVSSKLGKVLATADGQTLYRRNGYVFQSGSGHSLRRGDSLRPAVGRDIGTEPQCVNACEKWHPFLAPDNARPRGDWTVAVRADGKKQWVHRGYALWTFDGDREPGDIN
ncbi:MAG: hypothetical protein RLN70_11545, partial [Rhodospirillaceae bacterium]